MVKHEQLMFAHTSHNFYSASALLAMQTAVIARAILSVRPSVRPSVTFRCFVQTNEDTIMRFSASSRKIVLVYGKVKFVRYSQGITPSEGFQVKHPLSLANI